MDRKKIKLYKRTISAVGKHHKKSKYHYSWEFELDNIFYTIDFFHSKITRKFLLKINGIETYKTKGVSKMKFNFKFKLRKVNLEIKYSESIKKFVLYIDSYKFHSEMKSYISYI